jgi:hypothetical protein
MLRLVLFFAAPSIVSCCVCSSTNIWRYGDCVKERENRGGGLTGPSELVLCYPRLPP